MKIIRVLPLILILQGSCVNKAETEGRYFVFGLYNSMAAEDGTELYLLKGGHLYPDDMKRLGKNWTFSKNALPRNKYKLAKTLKDELPDYFKHGTSTSFVNRNHADQAIYIVRIGTWSSEKTYYFDFDAKQQPEEIKSYVQKVIATLKDF